jgi:hypothetical protein
LKYVILSTLLMWKLLCFITPEGSKHKRLNWGCFAMALDKFVKSLAVHAQALATVSWIGSLVIVTNCWIV